MEGVTVRRVREPEAARGASPEPEDAPRQPHGPPPGFNRYFEGGGRKLAFRAAYAVYEDYGLAEDAAQETMLAALTNWLELEPTRRNPWIIRVAKNKMIDILRKRRPEVEIPEELPVGPAQHGVVGRILVDQWLERLPPPLRETFVLHHVNGLSDRQIGERLGIGSRTVSNRLVDARILLRSSVRRTEKE